MSYACVFAPRNLGSWPLRPGLLPALSTRSCNIMVAGTLPVKACTHACASAQDGGGKSLSLNAQPADSRQALQASVPTLSLISSWNIPSLVERASRFPCSSVIQVASASMSVSAGEQVSVIPHLQSVPGHIKDLQVSRASAQPDVCSTCYIASGVDMVVVGS